jgi:endonuclease YncB( thermonuclease family)
VHVLDGDSVVIGDGRQIRLIGVNAPELGHSCGPDSREVRAGRETANGPSLARGPRLVPIGDCTPSPDQPLAREARARLAALIERRRVRLTPGHEPQDRHGRLLAHIEVSGASVEDTLLREGLAWMVAIPPNVSRLEALARAEAEARAAGRGVWREPALAPVEGERLATVSGGFHLVKAEVRAVRRGRSNHYFELAPKVVVVVSAADWRERFQPRYGAPEALAGRRVLARGWFIETATERRLRVSHPAMLTFEN